MAEIVSVYRRIQTPEEAARLCGIQQETVNQWFITQVGLLGIMFPEAFWHDAAIDNGAVSLMNTSCALGSECSANAMSMVYVVNFSTALRSRLFRDGRGWVRMEQESIGVGKR